MNNQLTDNSTLTSIYLEISTNSTFDNFDNDEVNEAISAVVLEAFPKDFIVIESIILQRSVNLINESFVKLVNSCKKEPNINAHIGFIFIFYVDYFSLDYTLTFKALHPNIQKIIKFYFKSKIGDDNFKRLTEKYRSDDTSIKSLFDL